MNLDTLNEDLRVATQLPKMIDSLLLKLKKVETENANLTSAIEQIKSTLSTANENNDNITLAKNQCDDALVKCNDEKKNYLLEREQLLDIINSYQTIFTTCNEKVSLIVTEVSNESKDDPPASTGGYVKSIKKQPLNKKISNPHISNFLNNF
jgi:chromosome segregation ATPase